MNLKAEWEFLGWAFKARYRMSKSWGWRESHERKPASRHGWGRGGSGLGANGSGIVGIYQRWPVSRLPWRRRQEKVTGTELVTQSVN